MTSEDSSTVENEALLTKIGAMEREVAAVKRAVRRGSATRLTLLLLVIALISVFVWMFYNLAISLRKGERAPANPWGGTTLEWSLPSPPPMHCFEDHQPVIPSYPYDFSQIVRDSRENEQ